MKTDLHKQTEISHSIPEKEVMERIKAHLSIINEKCPNADIQLGPSKLGQGIDFIVKPYFLSTIFSFKEKSLVCVTSSCKEGTQNISNWLIHILTCNCFNNKKERGNHERNRKHC